MPEYPSNAVLVYRARGGKLTLEAYDAEFMLKGFRDMKFKDEDDEDEPKTLRDELDSWEMSNRRSWREEESDFESDSEPQNWSDFDIENEDTESDSEIDEGYADRLLFRYQEEMAKASESEESLPLTKKERKMLKRQIKQEKKEKKKQMKDANKKTTNSKGKTIFNRIGSFFRRIFHRDSISLKDWVIVEMIDDYKFHDL